MNDLKVISVNREIVIRIVKEDRSNDFTVVHGAMLGTIFGLLMVIAVLIPA